MTELAISIAFSTHCQI